MDWTALSIFYSNFRELGIGTVSKCENEQQELFKLAETLFDTKLPPGVTMLQPFSEESSIKKIAVQVSIWFDVLIKINALFASNYQ